MWNPRANCPPCWWCLHCPGPAPFGRASCMYTNAYFSSLVGWHSYHQYKGAFFPLANKIGGVFTFTQLIGYSRDSPKPENEFRDSVGIKGWERLSYGKNKETGKLLFLDFTLMLNILCWTNRSDYIKHIGNGTYWSVPRLLLYRLYSVMLNILHWNAFDQWFRLQ